MASERRQTIDRIIQAVEGCVFASHTFTECCCRDKIVAALDAERAEEREECAKVAESYKYTAGAFHGFAVAQKIRARGGKP